MKGNEMFDDWNIIDNDKGLEMELLLARLSPFDGVTVYDKSPEPINPGTYLFMGYVLQPYKIVHRQFKKTFAIGTTIRKMSHTILDDKIVSVGCVETNAPYTITEQLTETIYLAPELASEEREAITEAKSWDKMSERTDIK